MSNLELHVGENPTVVDIPMRYEGGECSERTPVCNSCCTAYLVGKVVAVLQDLIRTSWGERTTGQLFNGGSPAARAQNRLMFSSVKKSQLDHAKLIDVNEVQRSALEAIFQFPNPRVKDSSGFHCLHIEIRRISRVEIRNKTPAGLPSDRR